MRLPRQAQLSDAAQTIIESYAASPANEGDTARELAAEVGCSVSVARRLLSRGVKIARQQARDDAGLVKYTVECMATSKRWTNDFPVGMKYERGTGVHAWAADCRQIAGRAVQVLCDGSLIEVIS